MTAKKAIVESVVAGELAEVVPGQAIIFKDMEQIMRGAELMATAKNVVPKHLLGEPGSCMAVIMQAQRWGMEPFAVAQKTHVVNGTLGYEAQLVNAVIQNSRMITGRFHYEYQGEGANIACRVGAILRNEQHTTWGEWLSFADVAVKNSPLWKTNPKQQLGYLQVKNWSRLYCPGAILGVYTTDDLQDSPVLEREINPAAQTAHGGTGASSLKSRMIPEEAATDTPQAPQEATQAQEPEADAVPATTYADVADALNGAGTPQELQASVLLMAEFVGIEENEKFKDELSGLYRTRIAELKAIADEQNQ